MARAALASGFSDDRSPHHARFRVIAAIEADADPTTRPPALLGATDTPDTAPRKELAELTCADIEAMVYAKLPAWAPPAGSTQECTQAAAAVGYAPGLASQIARPE